jgi:hypothetical protein
VLVTGLAPAFSSDTLLSRAKNSPRLVDAALTHNATFVTIGVKLNVATVVAMIPTAPQIVVYFDVIGYFPVCNITTHVPTVAMIEQTVPTQPATMVVRAFAIAS